jgi:hypothetical protein
MAKYYVALRQNEAAATVSKHRGKLPKGILFLQDDADPPKVAITHQELADFHFKALKHPAYSPDLDLSDYYLFPKLKKRLKARNLSTEDATLAVDGWIAA